MSNDERLAVIEKRIIESEIAMTLTREALEEWRVKFDAELKDWCARETTRFDEWCSKAENKFREHNQNALHRIEEEADFLAGCDDSALRTMAELYRKDAQALRERIAAENWGISDASDE